jgi:8-oxo-dGTP pyrophosphatase MutT (NUDIX family)
MTVDVDTIRRSLIGHNRKVIDDKILVRAGVLVPIINGGSSLTFLLTKRTEDVEHHKGQISFPGGAADKDDSDIVSTALRETEEEIGLARNEVEILGMHDDLSTPSGFVVTPVIGFIVRLPPLRINPSEVAECLHVPLSFFLNRASGTVVHRERGGKMVDVYSYLFGKHDIWGATAAIIHAFLQTIVHS